MKVAVGVVENGQIKLEKDVLLPEGATVRVTWEESDPPAQSPYDREPVTATEIWKDLEWATGQRFPQ